MPYNVSEYQNRALRQCSSRIEQAYSPDRCTAMPSQGRPDPLRAPLSSSAPQESRSKRCPDLKLPLFLCSFEHRLLHLNSVSALEEKCDKIAARGETGADKPADEYRMQFEAVPPEKQPSKCVVSAVLFARLRVHRRWVSEIGGIGGILASNLGTVCI